MMNYLYCQNPVHCSAVVAVIYLLRRFNHMILKKSARQTGNVMSILSNQQMVNEYSKLISKNDVFRFEDNKEDSITVIVIFEREGRIKGKFVFHFVIESIPSYSGRKKIKSLRIRFLD